MDLGLGQNGFERGGGLAADSALPQTLTPGPSPRGERGEADPLELIAAGRYTIEEVCIESKMSILELAEYVCTTQNLAALGRVAHLHAIQREMLLGKLKRDALIRLAELTAEVGTSSSDEVRACEVMRKACADLLRYGGSNTEKRSSGNGEPTGPGSRRHHRESITPATEAEVLEALERWGREEEEEEYPQITQIAQMNSGGFKSIKSNEPRTQVSGSSSSSRASGDVEPPDLPPALETVTNRTRTRRVPPLKEADRCGCHGQVPPARACEYSADPRAKSPRRPSPWHPARDPNHQPRPPPLEK